MNFLHFLIIHIKVYKVYIIKKKSKIDFFDFKIIFFIYLNYQDNFFRQSLMN
jgi:hypothetical protein